MSNQIRNTNISIQGKSLAFRKDVGTAYAQRGVPELYTVTNDGLSFNKAIIGRKLDDGSEKIIAIFIDDQFIKITE
ncbi:MAG: hypothetical protein IKR17_02670 [Bacteroidales bacterium]|nr:hypothetical protein [Bacteroidales bacterium]